jgi:hypothetical protein
MSIYYLHNVWRLRYLIDNSKISEVTKKRKIQNKEL